MLPLDALPLVFILLLSQDQLNEQLLQLLITVIYTELLKAGRHQHQEINYYT